MIPEGLLTHNHISSYCRMGIRLNSGLRTAATAAEGGSGTLSLPVWRPASSSEPSRAKVPNMVRPTMWPLRRMRRCRHYKQSVSRPKYPCAASLFCPVRCVPILFSAKGRENNIAIAGFTVGITLPVTCAETGAEVGEGAGAGSILVAVVGVGVC